MADENDVPECALPPMAEPELPEGLDPLRQQLIVNIRNKWSNGTTMYYYFWTAAAPNPNWNGDPEQKDAVREAFRTWKQLGIGLNFQEVHSPEDSDLRIGFLRGDGSWSYIGTYNRRVDTWQRTMNFGWDVTHRGRFDTALHEIGHALGFHHEHQNPNSGIVWNEPAVLAYYSGPPNYWDQATIRRNILNKLNPRTVAGSVWDPNSIMHYQFRKLGLILQPEEYQTRPLIPEPGLSKIDIDTVRYFYPEINARAPLPPLKPFESARFKVKPGEQVDYKIEPTVSRKYTLRTFGDLDARMELLEVVNGEAVLLEENDDSGTDGNAEIKAKLLRSRAYHVRVRTIYSTGGDAGIMVW